MTQPFDNHPAERRDESDAETIELELSAEQMLALTQAAAHWQPAPVVAESTAERLPKIVPPSAPIDDARASVRWRGHRAVAIISIAAATSVAVSGIAYFATNRNHATQVVVAHAASNPTTPEPAPPPEPISVPVRFPNPFDATEVFEFPSGTSETQARDAVAALLLERALERQASIPESKPRRKKNADKGTTVAAANVVHRE